MLFNFFFEKYNFIHNCSIKLGDGVCCYKYIRSLHKYRTHRPR